jgi:gamma-glutamyl hercynylcysteine S-oxide synthase
MCSFYEAQAYCCWSKTALLTESEFEYLAKKEIIKGYSNLNYQGLIRVQDNSDLIGNVWNWCDTNFYPYDGFKIGYPYQEFSYPFFGYKKICRGASWATPNELAKSYYRNAQLPNTQHQYIGFRIKKVKL